MRGVSPDESQFWDEPTFLDVFPREATGPITIWILKPNVLSMLKSSVQCGLGIRAPSGGPRRLCGQRPLVHATSVLGRGLVCRGKRRAKPVDTPHEDFHPALLDTLDRALFVGELSARHDEMLPVLDLTGEAFGRGTHGTAGPVGHPRLALRPDRGLRQCESQFRLPISGIAQSHVFRHAVNHDQVDAHRHVSLSTVWTMQPCARPASPCGWRTSWCQSTCQSRLRVIHNFPARKRCPDGHRCSVEPAMVVIGYDLPGQVDMLGRFGHVPREVDNTECNCELNNLSLANLPEA